MPKASIITPLFNKAPYLAETIRSVQAQTFRDWEMIVVDNNSNDDGPSIARSFANEDARIRATEVTHARGPGKARNHGLDMAAGGWILFLDADDLLEPGYLEERLSSARACDDADVVAGKWQEFPDAQPEQRIRRFPAGWKQNADALEASAIAFAPWAVHSALVRREWLDGQRRWQEELDGAPSEDSAFWFRVILGARIAWADGDGALYRKTTPTSRDAIPDAPQRFSAVCGVIEHNVAFLRACGREPSAAQRATLVRVFEEEHRRARAAGCADVAQQALQRAHEWLTRGVLISPGMLLRRVIGLQHFQQLRHHRA